ncbi:MAG: murein L,D-transpeptidase catalytic domain family protein [Myxococcota bacterium]|nr:murein L,D-transpeptidase catalytic domain family protein [Myxococcota bacterium]
MLFFLLACVRHDTNATLRASAEAAYPGLRAEVLEAALTGYRCARREGFGKQRTLTIIDFEQPSTEKRLWVIGLRRGELLFHDYVAHGKNTGEDLATDFSNTIDSKQSSLGMFATAETYIGKNGLSMRLDGLELGINDAARERYIVLHGADYVSEAHIEAFGRLGRSWGCPAVPVEITEALIDRIDEGTLLFVWYPDSAWLKDSRFLHCP